jgi:hypothetical protein
MCVCVCCTLISKFESGSTVKMLYAGGHLQNSWNMWQILIQVHVTLCSILTFTGRVLRCCNRKCAVLLDATVIMPELQYGHQQCRTRTFRSYFTTVRLMELCTHKVTLKQKWKVGCYSKYPHFHSMFFFYYYYLGPIR